MNSKIDWSKAPEDATHYGPETDRLHAAWYKKVDSRWMVWIVDVSNEWHFTGGLPASAIARPAEWDGTGLPPVGTECEGNEYGEWVRLEVIAHYEGRAVCMLPCKERVALADPGQIRPIRKPEQSAADKREKAIEDLRHLLSKVACDDYHAAVAMIDAGYRKTE